MKLPGFLPTVALLAFTIALPAATPPGKTQQLTSPDQVPEGLAKSDWASIRAAYEAGRHAFQPIEGGWQARNPGQRWTTKFDGRGFVAEPRDGGWTWGLELKSYGFTGAQRVINGTPEIAAEGQRLTYEWDSAVHEWWVNDKRGLEHGFTIKERPAQASSSISQHSTLNSQLAFTLAVRGSLVAHVAADGLQVDFCDAGGATVITYAGLKVWDADCKALYSRFEMGSSQLTVRLFVDERGARYPLTIDPIAQQAYLKPALVCATQASDQFGCSVAVSGDTVVVGALAEDSSTAGVNSMPDEGAQDAGAAYVFVRSAGGWSQQAYLKPEMVGTTQAGDQFGISVAISGDTVVVGADTEDSNTTGVNSTPEDSGGANFNAGAAYVFVRSGVVWTQQAYLKPAAVGISQGGDRFGHAVAISRDTVVVGAYLEDGNTTGVNSIPNEGAGSAGAAYVFVRNTGVWTQQAYLKPAAVGTAQSVDEFGWSVAISADTIVIGAPFEDSSTTGVNSTPDDTGGINFDGGAAYIFVRSAGVWTQQAYLKPAAVGTTQAGDQFGYSVAVSGETVVVGAILEDSNATGVNSVPDENANAAGAAYVFVRSAGIWTQQAYLKPAVVGTTQAVDQFGRSVATVGDRLVVGAVFENSGSTGVNSTPNEDANDSGAAYLFVRNGTTWMQQAYLKPAAVGTMQASDQFGASVSISDELVVVGAPREDSNTTGTNSTPNESATDSGAAYIFAGPGPEIVIEQPTAADLTAGMAGISFAAPLGISSAPKVFTIRNLGVMNLTITAPAVAGGNASDFTVNTTGTLLAIPAGQSTTFTTTFTPGAGGARSTTLRILNDDANENPFDIALFGKGLLISEDTDGDGLNDVAEYNLSTLGFDWQVSQPALVAALATGAESAGYYTAAQVQTLNVGVPLLTKDAGTGRFKLTIGVQKTTSLALPFADFPMNGAGFTTIINGAGKLEFEFAVPDNAAFFRLESQ